MTEIEMPPPRSIAELRQRVKLERRERRREERDRRVQRWGRRITDVAGLCYKGSVRVFQFPAYVFDLLDRSGKPDHSKIGPFLVSQELIALQAWDVIKNKQPLNPIIVVLIGVLSFASMSLMRLYIEKVRMSAASTLEQVNVKVREEFIRTEDQLPKRNDDERGLPQ